MGIIEKMRLDGKKGFVTGAARGIGKCTASAFAEAGADIAIVDIDIDEAEKTAKEIAEKTGRKVIAIKTDCTVKEQVDAMVQQAVKELGGLDFCQDVYKRQVRKHDVIRSCFFYSHKQPPKPCG